MPDCSPTLRLIEPVLENFWTFQHCLCICEILADLWISFGDRFVTISSDFQVRGGVVLTKEFRAEAATSGGSSSGRRRLSGGLPYGHAGGSQSPGANDARLGGPETELPGGTHESDPTRGGSSYCTSGGGAHKTIFYVGVPALRSEYRDYFIICSRVHTYPSPFCDTSVSLWEHLGVT